MITLCIKQTPVYANPVHKKRRSISFRDTPKLQSALSAAAVTALEGDWSDISGSSATYVRVTIHDDEGEKGVI